MRDDALTQACRRLVAFKDHLDAYLFNAHQLGFRSHAISASLAGLFTPDQWGVTAIGPHAFITHAFPFVDRESRPTSQVPMPLDPRLVISGTYETYEPTATESVQPEAVMDWSDLMVNDPTGDWSTHYHAPRIARVGDLPLFYALEGKNRVLLFKRYRRTMHAFVRMLSFPPADRMTLLPLVPFGQYAVEYGGEQHVLPFPGPTVDVLRAYGVKEARKTISLRAWREARRIRRRLVGYQMLR
jgi:hypothetical protein